MSESTLQRTPLWPCHVELKARLVPFSGYEMPVQYTSVLEEHSTVRNAAGLFDVAHMGALDVSGTAAESFLDYACTRKIAGVVPGRAVYSLMCLENGGTVDDLIVYRLAPESFRLVLNAGNKHKDLAHLKSIPGAELVEFRPRFDDLAILALQGPRAEEILRIAGFEGEWPRAFRYAETRLFGRFDIGFGTTGYTGESGGEIFAKAEEVADLWRALLDAGRPLGLKPVGLGARDTLRTEMGYSLYGHELTESINPIEAGLGWAVSFDTSFLGKAALERAQLDPKRKIVGLKRESRQAPRAGMPVVTADGKRVGEITSGSLAPSLGYVVGLALVEASASGPYFVDIRGEKIPFETAERPFYKKPDKKPERKQGA